MVARLFTFLCLLVSTGCVTHSGSKQDLPVSAEIRKLDQSQDVLSYLDLHRKFARIEEDNPPESITRRWNGGFRGSPDVVADSSNDELEEIAVTGVAVAEESITNNQEKGVDQGDIVKRLGDHILILRKGVLYSIYVGRDQTSQMRLVSKVPVQSNGEDHDSWYDELLVHDGLLLVVGYSYDLNASEMIFFKMDINGALSFHQRYLLKSNDYYDTQNSATRIVDGKLLMVVPTWVEIEQLRQSLISGEANTMQADLFRANSVVPEKVELVSKQDWIQTSQKINAYDSAVSQVYSCPLEKVSNTQMQCEVVNLLGVSGKFYVSPNAVYVWDGYSQRALNYEAIGVERYAELSSSGALNLYEAEDDASVIYRVDHQNSETTAVVVHGAPINQFSFREKGERFSVVSNVGRYDGNEFVNDVYGLDFPTALFSVSSPEIDPNQYILISSQQRRAHANRFIDDMAFVSVDASKNYRDSKTAVSIWNVGSGDVDSFEAEFDVQAFHPLGENMLAMGQYRENSLVLETWSTSSSPRSLQLSTFDNYSSTESRSVGFNSAQYGDTTVFGIPVIEHQNERRRSDHYWHSRNQLPMDIVYFDSNSSGSFAEIGRLNGNREKTEQDKCKVSCFDWYGVARPFFIDDQIYGLIDFELLRGSYSSDGVRTNQRLNIQNGELNFE